MIDCPAAKYFILALGKPGKILFLETSVYEGCKKEGDILPPPPPLPPSELIMQAVCAQKIEPHFNASRAAAASSSIIFIGLFKSSPLSLLAREEVNEFITG